MAVVPNLVLGIRTYAVTSAQRYINWFCIPTSDNSQPAWYTNSDTFIIRTLNNNLQEELLSNLSNVVLYNGNDEWKGRLISQEVNWPHIPSEVKGFWERTKCKKLTLSWLGGLLRRTAESCASSEQLTHCTSVYCHGDDGEVRAKVTHGLNSDKYPAFLFSGSHWRLTELHLHYRGEQKGGGDYMKFLYYNSADSWSSLLSALILLVY